MAIERKVGLACIRALRNLRRSRTVSDALVASERTNATVFALSGSCRRIIYATKDVLIHSLLANQVLVPSDVEFISRPGVVVRSYAALVKREAQSQRATVSFVGDLDPSAVGTYLSLIRGGIDARADDNWMEVDYVGVGDDWLRLCASRFAAKRGSEIDLFDISVPSVLCTKVTPDDRKLLHALERAGLDAELLVGPNSIRLLRAGLALDLQTACRRALYRPSFTRALGKVLRLY